MNLKACLGYAASVLAILVSGSTFLGMNYYSHQLVSVTGLKISPWYTGGKVVKTMDRGLYKVVQHRAVFDGLIGKKAEGFVQIDFLPLNGLPDVVSEDIELNLDGKTDFHLVYDVSANSAALTSYGNHGAVLEGCYKLKERRAVRIMLNRDGL